MRKFLIAFLLLACVSAFAQGPVIGAKTVLGAKTVVAKGAAGGGAAPTLIQSCTGNGGANPEDCNNSSFPGNVTSGNCIVCMFQFGSNTLSSIGDSTGGSVCNGTWNPIDNNISIAGGNRIGSSWYTTATGTGTCDPHATWATGNGGTTFWCAEVHGQGSGAIDTGHKIDDAGNGSFAAANSLAGTSQSNANANDLILVTLVLTGTPAFVAGTSPLTYTLQGSLLNVIQLETAVASGTTAQGTASNTGGTGFGGVIMVPVHP